MKPNPPSDHEDNSAAPDSTPRSGDEGHDDAAPPSYTSRSGPAESPGHEGAQDEEHGRDRTGGRAPQQAKDQASVIDTGVGGKVEADGLLAVVHRLEQDLDQLRRELAWSQRLATLGSLAAVIAHEVNNALTPITSYAQLALADRDDAALTQKALEAAVNGVERAARIASSVLGMVQDAPPGNPGTSASGPLDDRTSSRVCALREAVEASLACLARDPAREGIDVHIDLPDVDVAIARGDLQQVLVNLFLNARKAMLGRPGQQRLSVTGKRLTTDHTTERGARPEVLPANYNDDDAAWLELVVADTGPGIPEHVYGRLFEAFVTSPIGQRGAGRSQGQHNEHNEQGNASDERTLDRRRGGGRRHTDVHAHDCDAERRGTGLGLSICRDLIERAAGTITADPPDKAGAVFRIRLRVV